MSQRELQPISGAAVSDAHHFPLLPADVTRLAGVRVYKCGQGDAIGVIGENSDGAETIVLHIDYGGYQHNPHQATGFTGCLSRWPLDESGSIVLTHWDQDHYWTALRDSALHSQSWLVPRQKVSPRIARFSADLDECRCWPEEIINQPICFQTSEGDELWIEKLKPMPTTGVSEDRNVTGLAVSVLRKSIAPRHPYLIVCPGDAPYSRITHLPSLRSNCILFGLVAYHHGSHVHWSQGDIDIIKNGPTYLEPKVVYSCARGNRYGHPHPGNYRAAFSQATGATTLEETRTYELKHRYEDIRFPT